MSGEKTKKVKKKKKPAVKALEIIGIVIGALVFIAAVYVVYVFVSFHRIEDNQVLEVKGSAAEQTIAADKELTITSYNIGFGAYSEDYSFFMDGGTESWAFSKDAVYQNIEGAMDIISGIGPELALFQEVDFDATRSYHVDERQLVTERMEQIDAYSHTSAQNYDSPFLMYPFTQPHGANQACIMTFSNAQISSGIRRSLPIEEGLSKVLDLDRCYSVSRVPTDNGKELVLINLHLSAYTSDAQTAETQLAMVIEEMQAEYDKGNYCIAGGDFNRDLLGNSPEIFGNPSLEANWAQPVNLDLFTEDITLVTPYDENHPIPSCRNADQPYGIDSFVVTVDGFIKSANVEVISSDVIDTQFQYSDHNPVYLEFKLKK